MEAKIKSIIVMWVRPPAAVGVVWVYERAMFWRTASPGNGAAKSRTLAAKSLGPLAQPGVDWSGADHLAPGMDRQDAQLFQPL